MTTGPGSTDVWSALLGRARDAPAPADLDVWRRVADHLNPARARPHIRDGVERADLTSARGADYAMLRSPDTVASYVRLTPEEADLALAMDGSRTVAQLVGDFARSTGSLAPDRVRRIVADLAGGRMLDELPLDAYAPLDRVRRRPWPVRVGRSLARAASGQRYVIANPDRAVGLAHRLGGRLFFTRAGAATMAVVSVAGFALWLRSWFGGADQVSVIGGSYGKGALLLLGLNVLGLLCHEMGHALAAKHVGRHVPAAGFLLYFGIPTAYVDTTDAWMTSRRNRLLITASGPGFAITFAGAAQLVALVVPELRAVAFPLGFAWYLNSLFNLNPLMALDGYYLLADWLEVPNLRPRATALLVACVRRPSTLLRQRTGDDYLIELYAVLSALWLLVFGAVTLRLQRDRFGGLWVGLWSQGWWSRLLLVAIVSVVLSPLLYAIGRSLVRRAAAVPDRRRQRRIEADQPRRLAALRGTELAVLDPDRLDRLAAEARWLHPAPGSEVVTAGAAVAGTIAVIEGSLEGRRRRDPAGTVRARAEVGQVIALTNALRSTPSSLTWRTAGTRLLVIPSAVVQEVIGGVAVGAPDHHEIATAMASVPALAGLTSEESAVIEDSAALTEVGPGQRFALAGTHAAIVGAGVLEIDGEPVPAGSLLGPPGDEPLPVLARTAARVWSFPVGGLVADALGRPPRPAVPMHWGPPRRGVHGDHGGPPPPPAPTDPVDGDDDGRSRVLERLIVLLLLLAILAWLLALWVPARVWAEIPEDTALLEISHGHASARLSGVWHRLAEGDRALVRSGDLVLVDDRLSAATVAFRGGAEVLLCPGTDASLDRLRESRRDPVTVAAAFDLTAGAVIVDTDVTTGAFAPLALTIGTPSGEVTNDGAADFRTSILATLVGDGVVAVDDVIVPADDGAELLCGRGGPGTASDGPTTTSPTTDATVTSTTGTTVGTTTTTDDLSGTSTSVAPTATSSSTAPPSTSTVPTTGTPTSPPTTATPTTVPPRPLIRVALTITTCPPNGFVPGYTCTGTARFTFGPGGPAAISWSIGGTALDVGDGFPVCVSVPFSLAQPGFAVPAGTGTTTVDRTVTLAFADQPAIASDGSPTSVGSVSVAGSAVTDSDPFGDVSCIG